MMEYDLDLQQALQKLQDIERAMNESSIVVITDERGRIQFANDKFTELSQYSREELIGSYHSIVNSGYHSRDFFKDMWRTIGQGHVWRGEIKNRAKDGSFYWVDTTIVPFLNDDGKPYQYIAIRHDITERKRYERQVERVAFYDPVTSLPNRNYLQKWLEDHSQKGDRSYAILFIDLDRFKQLNDQYGHELGDAILIEAGSRLNQCASDDDVLLRHGGDDFIMLLEGYEDHEQVREVVRQLYKAMSKPIELPNGDEVWLTLSIGVSFSEDYALKDKHHLDNYIKQARTAMSHAHESNVHGHSCEFNSPKLTKKLDEYYQLEHALRHALEREEFVMYYHPIIDLKSGCVRSAEALLRWHNDELRYISPATFVPILEEAGLIEDVGYWILWTVVKQMRQWIDAGYDLERVCVNVSPLQFRSQTFVYDVKYILRMAQLPPHYLEIEVTERTLLESESILNELHDYGVKVSVDDFGTGYSSLSYLKRLPLDTLKIDKSFIQDMDKEGEEIVNTIIHLGKSLDFNVIAEGIETIEHVHHLQTHHCDEGQGFYWTKPLPADEFNVFFETHHSL
ncbi:diguanylate cyclase (GGDEF)-like protein/PAS domain S-box-containing protein [Alkalibacillus flavidus]|uniref:Diguanylate cyclase (GGDEF)-like protein/PAS domain S-box-containing protein n=1 Tax=Alkalibacillus flavidus TaxID=546021 RepID=A0ABV2KX14_9BACI